MGPRGQRAARPVNTDLCLCRLNSGTLLVMSVSVELRFLLCIYLVWKSGHSLGELHEDLALDVSEAHSLSAARAARTPRIHDEAKREISFKLNRKLFSIAFVLLF